MPTPTDIGEILQAAKRVLVSRFVFTDAQCFLALDSDDVMLVPAASPICALTFSQFRQRDDSIHSEVDPEDTPTMQGEIVCSLWIRIALDIEGQDTKFLTVNEGNVRGASRLIRQVTRALNNQTLVNEDAETIIWRTLNYTGFRNRGKWRKDKTWRRIDITFDTTFNLKVEDEPSASNPIVYTGEDNLIYENDDESFLSWS